MTTASDLVEQEILAAAAANNDGASFNGQVEDSDRSGVSFEPALPYPHDFLNLQTGLGPKKPSEAMALWPYRKHRPPIGTVDPSPADGQQMMMEVSRMRERLRTHIEQTFMKDARSMAQVWQLKVPSTNNTPTTVKDFVKALSALQRVEGSLVSERVVYMVAHHFHHGRDWLCNAVDAWCRAENIQILFPRAQPKVVGGKQTRSSYNNRGGFGACARSVKSEIVKQLMRNMLSHAGWCISTKDNSRQSQGKRYDKVVIRIEQALTDHSCYVVTELDGGKKAAGKNNVAQSSVMGTNANNPIGVNDLVGFGAVLASDLGVEVSPSKMQELLSKFNRVRDSVVPQPIDATRSKNAEEISDITSFEGEDHTPESTKQPASNGAVPPITSTTLNRPPVSISAQLSHKAPSASNGAAPPTTLNQPPVRPQSTKQPASNGAVPPTSATLNRPPVRISAAQPSHKAGAASNGAAPPTTSNQPSVSNSAAQDAAPAASAALEPRPHLAAMQKAITNSKKKVGAPV